MKKINKNVKSDRKKGWLNQIEKIGNSFPHPVALFALFAVLMVVLSGILDIANVSVTGQMIVDGSLQDTQIGVRSLLTREGATYILTSAISNFTNYAPLGMTLVAMLGVGLAEQSGFIHTSLKAAVRITPEKWITPALVFLGVMSNVASDAGYVLLIPLGGLVFEAYGRHPIAGMAAAFAGVSGGFSANLLVGAMDTLLTGITQTAVDILNPNYQVAVMGNYIFLAVSTFLITILGTWVTNKWVEPRLVAKARVSRMEEDVQKREAIKSILEVKAEQSTSDAREELGTLTDTERSALKTAGLSMLLFVLFVAIACIPKNSFFRNENGTILGRPTSPFLSGIVVLITLLFFIPAVVYGKKSKMFKNHRDICDAMAKSMASMGSFLALAFVSAQFINYFNYTQIGTLIAVAGANLFHKLQIGLLPLMIIFVLFSAFMNLFMGSASAKWNILAPVFVPMFMLLGYSPELCQLAYRIGDSCTNVITPMMTYYAVILTYARRYDKEAGIGTLTAMMMPYSIAFLIGWTLLLVIWIVFKLPIGIGAGLYY